MSALLNRRLMEIADLGRASQLVGDRWADLVADHAEGLIGTSIPIPDGSGRYVVEQVFRLDDNPEIARRASNNGLQNPDLLISGRHGDRRILQAADAKFSVETAKSKQVSEQVVRDLLDLGLPISDQLECSRQDCEIVPGIFISPDSDLTHHVLRRGRGIRKVSVGRHERLLLEVTATEMFNNLEGFEFAGNLFSLDDHPRDPESDMSSGLYYFRLVRTVVGNWMESNRPVCATGTELVFDPESFGLELLARTMGASNSATLIEEWTTDVDLIRQQRREIEDAIRPPIASAGLRRLVENEARQAGVVPPSFNKFRRRLGGWFRTEVCQSTGSIDLPLDNVDEATTRIRDLCRERRPDMLKQIPLIVSDLSRESESEG